MIRYHARWVLPVGSAPVAGGTVAVDGGVIAWVGPRDGAPPGADRDLGDVALTPGLVAAHADSLDDATADDDGRAGAMLAAGVTTVGTCTADGGALHAMRDAGLRGVAYLRVVGPAPADRDAAFAALRRAVVRLRPLDTPLVRLGVAPRSAAAVHEDLLVDVCAYAVGEGMPLAVHVAESAEEVAFLREGTGPLADALRARGVTVVRRAHSPVHLLVELGVAVVARPLLVAGAFLDASDAALAAFYGCPIAYDASGRFSPRDAPTVAQMIEAGARVGLTVTAPADGERPRALAAAWRAAGGPAGDAVGGDESAAASLAANALELATLGGARALGLDADVGSLAVGKQADLAAFPLGDVAAPDPVAALMRASPSACFVAVAGRVLVDGRRTRP